MQNITRRLAIASVAGVMVNFAAGATFFCVCVPSKANILTHGGSSFTFTASSYVIKALGNPPTPSLESSSIAVRPRRRLGYLRAGIEKIGLEGQSHSFERVSVLLEKVTDIFSIRLPLIAWLDFYRLYCPRSGSGEGRGGLPVPWLVLVTSSTCDCSVGGRSAVLTQFLFRTKSLE